MNWVESPITIALAWALVHFLWQGAAIAAMLAAILWIGREWPSQRRYAAAAGALFALPLAFGITAALYLAQGNAGVLTLAHPAFPTAAIPLSSGSDFQPAMWSQAVAWVTPLWMLGVLVFYLRTVGGWIAVRRLRASGAPAGSWLRRLNLPAAVPVLESCRIDVPMVIGLLRPAILVPIGFAAGLPPAQVEAVLLHELAHIRRHDPFVNLIQSLIEGLLFYHPAVWWISCVVRSAREHCCDDAVVAATGDRHGYAAALAALELARPSHQPALAANGGTLVNRIRRLLKPAAAPLPAVAPVLQSVAVLLLGAVAVVAWQSKPAAPPPSGQTAQAQTPYEKWVTQDVAYIIDDRERVVFKSLKTDEEREHFIEQFWLRRDPTPGTPANEFKEEHYRRIAYANEHYAASVPGWKTDRGRVYIVYGPADEIESHPGAHGAVPPYEIWFYRAAGGFPTWAFFVGSDYRLAPAGSPLRLSVPPQKPPVPDIHELPIR